jgi:hypothetical protein
MKGPMTVFIYVNTSRQVGDAEHLKVFANVDAAEKWFEENDGRAWRSSMRELNRIGHRTIFCMLLIAVLIGVGSRRRSAS